MSKCNHCSAELIWARTKDGKNMPLDKEPHPAGNVHLSPGGECEVLSAEDVKAVHMAEDLSGTPAKLYRSHFATCPGAAKYRRR